MDDLNVSGSLRLTKQKNTVDMVKFKNAAGFSSNQWARKLTWATAESRVLQKALEVWDYQNNPLNCPLAEPAQIDPELENAFICHLHDHWFCTRKVNGEWYNFNSLYTAPEHFSKFYLSAYLDSLKGAGWSVFLVRGNFPKEFHISSTEAFNGYGQYANAFDDDLKAAIAASLMDSSPAAAMTEASNPKSENKDSPEKIAKAENSLTYWASDNGSCHVLDGLSKHIWLEVVRFVMYVHSLHIFKL
ncbi:hypothetical protein CXB51_002797 [Gossypium anomalum]|uniref:ubiquitinyl hydrolase 1 n=1 Tax=Gossypium anomalum TaxID=47600 RepID=A0A8J5ZKM4_9ROSI|nr:hypothetical protein CXB51_002797 [Gossypium anomalum]